MEGLGSTAMWGHYTRVTVTHHCGSGAAGIGALLFAVIAGWAAYTVALALIPVVFYSIIVVVALIALLSLILIGANIYAVLRDKPVYEQFHLDTEKALAAHKSYDMIHATSERVEGDDSCPENTALRNPQQRGISLPYQDR